MRNPIVHYSKILKEVPNAFRSGNERFLRTECGLSKWFTRKQITSAKRKVTCENCRRAKIFRGVK